MSTSKDKLSVLVFKDNLVARNFQVPLRWFTSFGLLLGTGIFLTVLSSIVAFRAYHETLRTDPTRVNELEEQLSATQGEVLELRKKNRELQIAQNRASDDSSPSSSDEPSAGILFADFPASVRFRVSELAPPVEIDNLNLTWRGNRLLTKFDLLYSAKDGGSQQGRIMVVAHGTGFIQTHPLEALDAATLKGALLNPNQGETFSVARFRQVSAEFIVPSINQQLIEGIDIFIMSRDGEILIHRQETAPRYTGSRNTRSNRAAPAVMARRPQEPSVPAAKPKEPVKPVSNESTSSPTAPDQSQATDGP